ARGRARSRSEPSPGPRSIVLSDQAADRHARKIVKQGQYRLPNRPADVLEIDVDAVRARGSELSWKIDGAVIDRRVEAELVFPVRAFLRPAGDADRSRAGDFRELADQRPDRPARGGDHYGFGRLRFADQA